MVNTTQDECVTNIEWVIDIAGSSGEDGCTVEEIGDAVVLEEEPPCQTERSVEITFEQEEVKFVKP